MKSADPIDVGSDPLFRDFESIGAVGPNLINQYRPKCDSYFSSPSYELLAKPPFASLIQGVDRKDLTHKVKESLRFAKELGHVQPIVVGSVPFDVKKDSYLRLSTNSEFLSKEGNVQEEEYRINLLAELENVRLTSYPNEDDYKASVKKALRLFEQKRLDKVVLSRTLRAASSAPYNVKKIVKRLAKENKRSYTFAIDLVDDCSKDQSARPILVGASPELLISVRNGKIFANPLAGSEARTGKEEDDVKLSQQLLASEKDLHEHALVVKQVVDALSPYCSSLEVPSGPSVIKTPTMLHLSTMISGELLDPGTPSIQLALALHPTPAVCGFPTSQAKNAIADLEPHDRDAFCGLVGWCDDKGNGDWAVTIRCAAINDNEAILYAGAGVVRGSCPEKEWKETGAKFMTMLNALAV